MPVAGKPTTTPAMPLLSNSRLRALIDEKEGVEREGEEKRGRERKGRGKRGRKKERKKGELQQWYYSVHLLARTKFVHLIFHQPYFSWQEN